MILYGRFNVILPDEEYVWEPDEMTFGECKGVEDELEGTGWEAFTDWMVACSRARPVACQVLVWFLRYKAGKPSERRDVDFPLRKLRIEPIPDPKDEASTETSEAGTSSTTSEPTVSDQATSTP